MLLDIVSTITVPLLAVIGLGYLGCKRLDLDPRTMGQLLINVVAPGAFVYFLLSDPLPISAVGFVSGFALARFLVLYVVAWGIASIFCRNRVLRRAIGLAVAFPNSGNYGIPLVQLAFGDAFLFHQSVITSLHSILIVVAVPFLLPSGKFGFKTSLRAAFSNPLLPSVLTGIVIKSTGLTLPEMLMAPLGVLAAALTPLALLTLGAQIARSPRITRLPAVGGIVALRLVAAPLLSWVSLALLGVDSATQGYLVVNACVPVGILLAVLLAEHREVAHVITAAVAVSTAVAPFAVTGLLSVLG